MNDLNDPFNPKTGAFAKNIRDIVGLDDTELRESLKRHGWHPEFPALIDENGIIIVGHRRMRLAKQLGIEPISKQIQFGSGDAADAERVRLAIISNVGAQPFSRDDRKRIAEYLYGNKEWTMEAIAKALNVSHKTISGDLREFVPKVQTKRSQGGRPKSKPPRKNESISAAAAAKQILDRGKSYADLEQQTGLSNTVLRSAVAREEGRREAAPDVAPTLLSMSQREKAEAYMRQQKKKLQEEYEARVQQECMRRLNEISLPHYAKMLAELERSITSRKGIMDRITYRKILSCLHPDRVPDPALKKRYEEAFRLFTEIEKRVLDERESPTEFRKMPRTYEELMRMKAKVQAERRAKREGKMPVR